MNEMSEPQVILALLVFYGGPPLLAWLLWKWWTSSPRPSGLSQREREAAGRWFADNAAWGLPKPAPISKREEAIKRRADYLEKLRIIAEADLDDDTREAAEELALQWYRERLRELIE